MKYDQEQCDYIGAMVADVDPSMALVIVASIDAERGNLEFNFISRLENGQEIVAVRNLLEIMEESSSKPDLKIINGHGIMEEEKQGSDEQGN